MKANISKLFYKKYFDEFRDGKNPSEVINYNYLFEENKDKKKQLSDANKKILTKRNKQIIEKIDFVPIENVCSNKKHSIQATIQYPGLVTGVGISHEAKIEGEFKLGVHFDYTYGMPVIYGSSVKGVLRSAFPDEKDKMKIKVCKEKLIRKYLGVGFNDLDIDTLRDQIFKGMENGTPISIYKRDIFFDSVIKTPYEKKDSKGNIVRRILESDSITPHVKSGMTYENSMLRNPVPITFMKIASGVTMEFRFDLKDCVIKGVEVSADDKKRLFEAILLDFGIGAKTNVGYGQFEAENPPKDK